MAAIDVAGMKKTLAAWKGQDAQRRADPAAHFAQQQTGFRKGIEAKRRAVARLTGIAPPITPMAVTLDTPFLIWAFRNGTEASAILVDSHIEASNSWAKILAREEVGGQYGCRNQLNFYFFWQNGPDGEAVIDASTFLMLNGYCYVHADHGWIYVPLWGTSTIGYAGLGIDARLTLLEWWNHPPTEPVAGANQTRDVLSLSADGGWGFLSPGQTRSGWVSDNYHVAYDTLHVPRNGAVVFEVSLEVVYDGYNGSYDADFANLDRSIVCPGVELRVTPVSVTASTS